MRLYLSLLEHLICFPFDLTFSFIAYTLWIDVCPTNANLLASCGYDHSIKIFDRRESKIIKTIDRIHQSKIQFKHERYSFYSLDWVYSVRWKSSGDMVVTASADKSAKVIDFNTEKVIHTGTTPDGSKSLLTRSINLFNFFLP